MICEKPLAPTPQEIRQMIEARDLSGKLLMIAQHFRFCGISQWMKREIDTGCLGEVYHNHSWVMRRAAFIPTANFMSKTQSGGLLHRYRGTYFGFNHVADGQSEARHCFRGCPRRSRS